MLHGVAGHDFAALWPGVYVAVSTHLVAHVAHIYLEYFEFGGAQGPLVLLYEPFGKCGQSSIGKNAIGKVRALRFGRSQCMPTGQ
jgi:hypothetical protein